MLLQLDFGSEIHIYQQIRNQIVLGIASGWLRPGDKLPTIRALAGESGINMMTVSKAYQLLKQEGYIHTDRRSGAVVAAGSGDHTLPADTRDALRLLVGEARLHGIDKERFLRECTAIFDEMEGK